MRQPGKLTINLATAIQAAASDQGTELTLTELVRAYSSVRLDGSDLRLKKWTHAFGHHSAWGITPEQLESAATAMLEHGYAPASANRDLSALGSTYRWAKTRASD